MSQLIVILLLFALLFFGCEQELAIEEGMPPSVDEVIIATPAVSITELPPLFAPDEAFPAFDFEGTTLDGEVITLDNRPTSWTVLNFWATWCVPCVEEMPALQTVTANYPQVTVLGMNISDTPEAIAAFAAENAITFPLLYNVTDQTVFDYNVVAVPQTVVIAPNGDMVWRQFGPIEVESFSADLEILFARYDD